MSTLDSSDPTDLEEHLAEAAKLSEAGDPEGAFQLLLALEETYAEDATLLCMLGLVAAEAETPGMAYDYFRRCLAAQPQDPSVLALLGTGLARFDDPDAESALRLAAVTAPDLPLARLRYGSYLAREGLAEQAVAELEAARSLDPEDPEIARELGIAHLLLGADERAAEMLETAAAAEPDNVDTRLLHGLALLRLRELGEAAEELHRSASEIPDDAEAQLVAALACASQDWMDEAWNALARAEGASVPPDQGLLQEVEEALEAGADAAQELLLGHIAPSILRDRLLERA